MSKTLEFSKNLAHRKAKELWNTYRFGSPEGLVLEDLAFALGIMVFEGKLDSADARMVINGNKGVLRVKEDIPEFGRKRFAIAHDIGHWILHKNETQFHSCTNEDMLAEYKTSRTEAEANFFASALLMPDSLFQPRMILPFSYSQTSELANFFNTSLTAAALRYVDLSSDYCAFIVSSNNTVKWWRGSECFRDKFWISPKEKLSVHTAAHGIFSGKNVKLGPEEVDLSAWVDNKPEDFEVDHFIEESLHLPNYNQVITFLRLP